MKMKAKATGLSVYIVEDNDMFRDTFMDVMSLQGVQVSGASCGREALQDLNKHVPSVLIIDIRLPDIHGFELCRRIKKTQSHRDVPVIFLTASAAYNDPRDQVEGFIAGAALFLTKPITMERLWKEIESLVGKQ